MHIILTHEQADFDALGALLGAYLLDDTALPVLPRRMNRNVRAFVNLYRSELPFVEASELPRQSIHSVTLVDTQGLVTLKGITRKTSVRVIDHHQARPNLPTDWQFRSEPLGACTSLFVEGLLERNGRLSLIQATLLLLGIYEDTGSLTYANTTARDVHAAAYLLDMGASLRLAGQYLNPPLSPDQRQLYERLLDAAQTHTIHQQAVVIACADAGEMGEEISSIAHKLRDLLDPDALFILVSTLEGIRLVARSTTDRVNVARAAAHFGGGGHERAAAALIRPGEKEGITTCQEASAELLHVLPDYVLPPVTVGQIMSRHPLILNPQMPASQALQLMQRYGYEGYPVADEQGRVVGLLKRRSVDRALTHKLDLTVGSLMEAGEIWVSPEDSLDHLQNQMTSHDWGQVPVVDPHTRQIIGIVTRTDLLKTLARRESSPGGRHNLAERLNAALPAARLTLLKTIASQAHEQRLAVYIVGGFVRDLILKRPSLDFDIVVEGDAITLGRRLAEVFGGRIVAHRRFGTAKWWLAEKRAVVAQKMPADHPLDAAELPEFIDLISARTEFYDHPTALPTVERSSIKLDLHRRDFTFNTLALRLDGSHYGELYDHWGGYRDLEKGLVRVLHSLSFVDDPTRMLRAVRFEQRFAFQIEARTLQLIGEARDLLRQVSGERLRHELDLILAEEKGFAMLARLRELNLLGAIHPQMDWSSSIQGAVEIAFHPAREEPWALPTKLGHLPMRTALAYLLWLNCLPAKGGVAVATRLRLSSELIHALKEVQALRPDLAELAQASPSQVVARLDGIPIISLYASSLGAPSDQRRMLETYQRTWKNIHPAADGHTLQALGLPPSPLFREILGRLRAAWLDGQLRTPADEKELLDRLLTEFKAPSQPADSA